MPIQQIHVTPYKPKENDSFPEEGSESILLNTCQKVLATSESGSSSHTSSGAEICRICHCDGETEGGFITPCYCAGSLRFVHQSCLQEWIKCSGIKCCELCKFQFIMQSKTKPFLNWEPLEMSDFERKKLICTVLFQILAITCVGWTLYTLVNATADEMNEDVLEWAFWMKLIIVAISFIGGVFFMYVQCKTYIDICRRWRGYNKVIYVQNAPEKQPLALDVSNSCESSLCEFDLPKSRQSVENDGDAKHETSISLKELRNTRMFFNDECRIHLRDTENEDILVGLPPFLKFCRSLGLT